MNVGARASRHVEAASCSNQLLATRSPGPSLRARRFRTFLLNGRSYLYLAASNPACRWSRALPRNTTESFNGFHFGWYFPAELSLPLDRRQYATVYRAGSSMNFHRSGPGVPVASAQFRLSTALRVSGAYHVVTRSGSNDFHGGAYFLYRDHNDGPPIRGSSANHCSLIRFSPAAIPASGSAGTD